MNSNHRQDRARLRWQLQRRKGALAREADIDAIRLELWVIGQVTLRRRELERLEAVLDRADVEAARSLLGADHECPENASL